VVAGAAAVGGVAVAAVVGGVVLPVAAAAGFLFVNVKRHNTDIYI